VNAALQGACIRQRGVAHAGTLSTLRVSRCRRARIEIGASHHLCQDEFMITEKAIGNGLPITHRRLETEDNRDG
jgi:hypothetical protein